MTVPDSITSVRHPLYNSKEIDWLKWRAVYDGGTDFVNNYLEKFSTREDDSDFKRRKKITPTPNFGKAAINDIKNSIFQRLVDVSRRDGSESYRQAIQGSGFGVDLQGSSMNGYIGRELLIEMLVMSRVGVFVDMPKIESQTLLAAKGKHPYLYKYRAEDILSWCYKQGSPDEYSSVLLRDYVEEYHGLSGLPTSVKERYRYVFIDPEDGFVHVRFYERQPVTGTKDTNVPDYKDIQVDIYGMQTNEDVILQINIIPFVLVDLGDSLLSDVANHQIALLNMESSDINYALLSNFPFYTEQDDTRQYSAHLQGNAQPNEDGTAADANKPASKELVVGATHGRRYSKGYDRPDFIHPSSEPLLASMKKQEALKDDIRTLVNLSLSNIKPKMASAESKKMDQTGLEAGLSNIGLVLEHAERKIARYWHTLEGKEKTTFSVKYPEKWSLKSEEDRRKDATSLRELRDTIPSARFQKSISKEIARLLLSDKISNEDIDAITREIDTVKSHTADPDTIFLAVDKGILDLKSAAVILGWPEEVVDKAAKDHAERLARISEAQSKNNEQANAARGVADLDGQPKETARIEKENSRDVSKSEDTSERVRGDQKPEAKL